MFNKVLFSYTFYAIIVITIYAEDSDGFNDFSKRCNDSLSKERSEEYAKCDSGAVQIITGNQKYYFVFFSLFPKYEVFFILRLGHKMFARDL